jgi:hypothetical protein
MHKYAPISLILLSLLTGTAPQQAEAANSGSRGLAMADAMLSMMDAMGMFGRDAGGGFDPGRGFSQPWGSVPGGFGSLPWASGWPGPGSSGANAWDPRSWWGQASGTSLDGSWVGRTGERLWIGSGRFRLESGANREIEGLLRLRDKILALYSPAHDRSWVYEYAEHEGRLALRDTQGRIYLYRRARGTTAEPHGPAPFSGFDPDS